jgi:hypothetical protein
MLFLPIHAYDSRWNTTCCAPGCVAADAGFAALRGRVVSTRTRAHEVDTHYHQSVVTPTGNVYFACARVSHTRPERARARTCCPRNSIVACTGCGFQLELALSFLCARVSGSMPRFSRAARLQRTSSTPTARQLYGHSGGQEKARTTRLYRFQSDADLRAVTYAPTRSAQFSSPPTDTPMRWPCARRVQPAPSHQSSAGRRTKGPPTSFGTMALLACAIA